MPLPTLDPDVAVYHQKCDPDLLDAECGLCGGARCVPVAEVGWHAGCGERSAMVVGSGCLPAAVEQVRDEHGASSDSISVDVPAWTLPDLAGLLGVAPVVVASWTADRLLDPEPKVVTAAPTRFLSDQAHLARAMLRLVVLEVKPRAAHRLLTGDGRELADAVADVLERSPRRKAVRA